MTRCLFTMTTENYHDKRTSDAILEDLYRVAVSIEEKVEEILEELKDLVNYQSESSHRDYSFDDYYHDHDLE